MNIGIDIDNVISNFNEVLKEEFLKHDKELRNTGIVNSNLHMTQGMFDWSEDEIWGFYLKNIERIAKNLEVKPGAKEYIDKLKEDGHRIVIITGRDNGEYTDPFNMTEKWLKEKEIKYDKLILTNVYTNRLAKVEICFENNIDIMIDDSKHNCRASMENNITTLLMDTPYNRTEKDMIRVNNWKEIYEFIKNYKREKLNVILDTDTYNECDDQFALAYLLKNQNKFNIEAITVAPYSNSDKKETIEETTEKSYNEILKICNWLNFETKNKVFKGSMDYVCNGYNENNDAVDKIIEIAIKNKKTYILAIGAITNVAVAIKKAPEIIKNIEIIWLGGNSFLTKDNNVEFNFSQDVSAVKEVFESKVKLTVIPCKNVASNLTTSIYELEHFLKGKSELCDYLCERFYNDTYHGNTERRIIWDISVIAYMINRTWFKTEQISCPIIKEDASYELTENRHNITFVNYLNANKIYSDLFEKLVK